MSGKHPNNFPKLHNAMWPGIVGKGSEGAEPFIDLDTMLNATAAAEVDGIKFDGVDIFLYAPHRHRYQRRGFESGRREDCGQGIRRGYGGGAGVVPTPRRWAMPGAGELSRRRSGRPAASRRHCVTWVLGRMGWCGLIRPRRRRTGRRTRKGTRRRLPRRSSRRRRLRGITANGWLRRGRFAGGACTRGGRWLICSSE